MIKIIQVILTINLLLGSSILAHAEITIKDVQHTTASDVCDGSITVRAEGSAGPFEIALMKDDQEVDRFVDVDGTVEFTDLCVGEYTVVIEDALGCTLELNTKINTKDCDLNIVLLNIENVTSCSNCPTESGCDYDGMIEVEVYAATENFTISWKNFLGQEISNAKKIENLTPGKYTIVVSHNHNHNCVYEESYEISSCTLFEYSPPHPGLGGMGQCVEKDGFVHNKDAIKVSTPGGRDGMIIFNANMEFAYSFWSSEEIFTEEIFKEGRSQYLTIGDLPYGLYYLTVQPLGCNSEPQTYYFRVCEPIEIDELFADNCCKVRDEEYNETVLSCVGSGYIGGARGDNEEPTRMQVTGGKGSYTYYFRNIEDGDNGWVGTHLGYLPHACEGTHEVLIEDIMGCSSKIITIDVPKVDDNKYKREIRDYKLEALDHGSFSECRIFAIVDYFCENEGQSCGLSKTREFLAYTKITPKANFCEADVEIILTLPYEPGFEEEEYNVTDEFEIEVFGRPLSTRNNPCPNIATLNVEFVYDGETCTTNNLLCCMNNGFCSLNENPAFVFPEPVTNNDGTEVCLVHYVEVCEEESIEVHATPTIGIETENECSFLVTRCKGVVIESIKLGCTHDIDPGIDSEIVDFDDDVGSEDFGDDCYNETSATVGSCLSFIINNGNCNQTFTITLLTEIGCNCICNGGTEGYSTRKELGPYETVSEWVNLSRFSCSRVVSIKITGNKGFFDFYTVDISNCFNDNTEVRTITQSQLLIIPNPTTGHFNIDISSEIKTNNIHLLVMDATGKSAINIMHRQVDERGSVAVPEGEILPEGLYFVQVRDADNGELIGVEKLIVTQ